MKLFALLFLTASTAHAWPQLPPPDPNIFLYCEADVTKSNSSVPDFLGERNNSGEWGLTLTRLSSGKIDVSRRCSTMEPECESNLDMVESSVDYFPGNPGFTQLLRQHGGTSSSGMSAAERNGVDMVRVYRISHFDSLDMEGHHEYAFVRFFRGQEQVGGTIAEESGRDRICFMGARPTGREDPAYISGSAPKGGEAQERNDGESAGSAR